MKKYLVLSFILLFLAGSSYAQVILSGRVLSQTDREPLPYSTVTVVKPAGNELVSGVITNDEGRFTFTNLAPGEYDVNIYYIGFEDVKRHIVAGTLNRSLDLGDIYLNPSALELGEVTVLGQRQTVSIALDRKTFSTAELAANAGGSVLDMMKSLPGLTVDQDSRLSIRGSDKVVILIDGKQSSLTGFGEQRGLENIPASQIESIEIINNPSAKYDAAGMAGIVNITFKKEKKNGFNGDAGFNFGIGQLTKRKADLPTGMSSYSNNEKYTPSLNLNYKQDKFNLFLQSWWLHQRRLPNNEFSTRRYTDGTIYESQVAENRAQNHYNIKLGIDWNPTPNQTFTLFGLYDYEWHIDTTRVWYFKDRNYDLPMRKWSFYESEGTGFTNITLQHKFRFEQPGHELNTNAFFTKGWEDETYNLYSTATPGYPSDGKEKTWVMAPEYIWSLSSDYAKPLSFGRLEAGVQIRLRHMPITYIMTRMENNTNFDFDYGDWSNWDENLFGAYANLVAEFAKFDIEAGLRGEYVDVEYKFAPNDYFHNDKYNYFDLFPNIRLTYKINPFNKLSLFYNRRIDRPGEDILRIFPKYDDPVMLKIGNPHLRPQYTQNVEAAYKGFWSNGAFFAAAYFKNIDAYYTRIYFQDPTDNSMMGREIKAYDNMGRAINAGMELILEQKIAKIWSLSASANMYR
ncbi:MAG: TonB-dependent receptor, partial [Tannerella sp.]|nr:TonB-dependent receptor [Tannerella sp.]